MPVLAAAAPYLMAASTIVSTAGQIEAGNQQKAAADYAAAQATNAGKAALAKGSAEASNEAQKTKFAISNDVAAAAAAGADTTSPSVVNQEGNIAGVGEYNVMSALFNGESNQNAYDQQAQTDIYQGEQAKTASLINAAGTIAKGGASMGEQYGTAFAPAVPSGALSWNTGAGPLPWLAQNRLPWQTG